MSSYSNKTIFSLKLKSFTICAFHPVKNVFFSVTSCRICRALFSPVCVGSAVSGPVFSSCVCRRVFLGRPAAADVPCVCFSGRRWSLAALTTIDRTRPDGRAAVFSRHFAHSFVGCRPHAARLVTPRDRWGREGPLGAGRDRWDGRDRWGREGTEMSGER